MPLPSCVGCAAVIGRGLLTPSRARAAATFAALALALLAAGCGTGSSTSTITVGAENEADNALITAKAETTPTTTAATTTSTTTSTSTTTATTPTSGPLSKEPTVPAQSGKPPTTLVTKDLIVGTGPEAKPGETVTVNYVGALYKTGKVFDASWRRKQPFTFVLGKGQVIAGWDKGVQGMKVGGRRLLIIPATLGYGAKGAGASIPPNSALVFVVDLLGT
jgi:peptidylprolyl isomerase